MHRLRLAIAPLRARLALLACLFALALFAPVRVLATAEDPSDVLVWGIGDDRKRVTVWLHANEGAFAPRGRREGVVLADGATLRRFESRAEPTRRAPCAHTTPGVSHAAVAILASLVGGAERRIARADVPQERGQYDFEFHASGELGPTLVVEERGFVSTCGAHGLSHAVTHLVDVRDGTASEWMSDREKAALVAAHRHDALHRIRDELRVNPPNGTHGAATLENDVRVVSFVPVFHEDGRVTARYLFVASTCYACGDLDWQSYERGTWIESERLPARLEGASVPGAAVRAAKAALPGVEVRGLSYVEGSAVTFLPRAFGGARR